ncbi:MAG: DegT/DnrJ/EryC1/StrS family aminotransferase [Myxococcota bacterium]
MTDPIRTKDNFLVFGQPSIEQPEIDEVVDSMEAAWLGTGPKAHRFEQDFADYKGVDHAVGVNSCTAAMHLCLETLDLDPDDEVITTPMTFCATVNTIIHAGGTPVLADVERDTMNIDPAKVEAAITPKTRAILPVHFAGRACDMDALVDIAERHDLVLIEDCAHAIETEYRGQKAGTFGDFGCFSFYATKNVVTGEGGMIITDDEALADRLRVLALHGMSKDAWARYSDAGYKHYAVVEAGFKYNMMDLQAAIGIHQLARVEENWQRRKEVWDAYQAAFSDSPAVTPAPLDDQNRHALHLYTLLVDEDGCGVTRDEFLNAMNDHNIGVGVHYLSVPEHPYYQENFDWDPDDYPNARDIGRQTVSLPLQPGLSDQDVADVIEGVRTILGSSHPETPD